MSEPDVPLPGYRGEDPLDLKVGEPQDASIIPHAFASILAEIEDVSREGLARTPERAALALRELTQGYRQDPTDLFTTFEADGYDEMVIVSGIPFYSLCEHHLLPFHGQAHVAYLPQGKIVGISKIPRLIEIFARRLQVQERLTSQVARAMDRGLHPKGVMVVIEAEHLCMTMRGVQKPGATTTTSVTLGSFRDKPEARAEALSLIERTR